MKTKKEIETLWDLFFEVNQLIVKSQNIELLKKWNEFLTLFSDYNELKD